MATREYQFIVGPETSTLPTIGSPSASTDLITLGYADSNYTQGKQSVADITALKAVTNTGDGARADGDVIEVQSVNSIYVFDAGSAAAGNDDTIVAPTTGTGRWLKASQPIAASTDNRLVRYDGTGGALQGSGITVDDSDNVTGVNNLTVNGDLTVQGTTTTLNTQTLDVEDINITVNKAGNDASSEGAGLTIDRTGTKGSIIYAAAAASKFKLGNLGSEIEIADLSSTQSLSNKSLVTPSTDIVTLDGQASAPANPSSGFYKMYVKDATQKLTVLNSSGVETTVGSGSGANNYLATENDGSAIGDFVTYADAAGTSPVDGTAGSPTVTFATSTDSSINGTQNFLFTHDAANRQGEGFSVTKSIDAGDRGKVLRLSFDYKIASGTYSDNDLTIWFYDVTNSTLIQGSPYQIKNSSLVERFYSEVQVPLACASLRIIFHVATSTATAYTIRFDNFIFGQQAKLYGSPITDWVSYTPTWAGGSPAIGNGSLSGVYRRNGDSAEIYIALISGTTTTWGSSTPWTFSLPSGLVIDTAKVPGSGGSSSLGIAIAQVTGSGNTYDGSIEVNSTTNVAIRSTDSAGNTFWNSTNPGAWAASTSNQRVFLKFQVPVSGWSSSVVMSSDADTRVVSFSGTNTGTQSVTANTTNIAVTSSKDTHSGWSGSVYTVSVAGDYYLGIVSADTVAVTSFRVYKNGSASLYIGGGQINNATSNSILMPGLVVGDTIAIRSTTTGTLIANTSISIFKLSGPAQIAASETIALRYTADGSGNLDVKTSGTKFQYDTKVFDSHGSWNTTTDTFTAKATGKYMFSGYQYVGAGSSTDLQNGTIQLVCSNSAKTQTIANGICSIGNLTTAGAIIYCTFMELLEGETVSLQNTFTVTTLNQDRTATRSWINITRIGI